MGIVFIHTHHMTIVLAVVIFLFDNLRQKKSEPLTKWSGVACFKNSVAYLLKFTGLEQYLTKQSLYFTMSLLAIKSLFEYLLYCVK